MSPGTDVMGFIPIGRQNLLKDRNTAFRLRDGRLYSQSKIEEKHPTGLGSA